VIFLTARPRSDRLAALRVALHYVDTTQIRHIGTFFRLDTLEFVDVYPSMTVPWARPVRGSQSVVGDPKVRLVKRLKDVAREPEPDNFVAAALRAVLFWDFHVPLDSIGK
jgi:hypothetical protein